MIGARFRIDSDIARQSALSARIARGQADIARTTRLAVASDDPLAAAQIARLDAARIDRAAWSANAEHALALTDAADAVLGSAQDRIDRARELATIAASATASPADRATIAREIADIADDLVALASTRTADGDQLFPATARAIPVGNGIRIEPVPSSVAAFGDTVDTLRRAASAIAGSDPAARDAALSEIVARGARMADVRGASGVRAARIDAVRERLSDADVRDAATRSTLADTDIAATVARIQGDQLALDASRGLFARINARTLFDLLG